MSKINMTKVEFDQIRPEVCKVLQGRLSDEVSVDEFCVGFSDQGAATDLWQLPEVPSKAVVKLSGEVEKYFGIKLPTKFIRSGGYHSVDEAVDHIVEQLRTLCK